MFRFNPEEAPKKDFILEENTYNFYVKSAELAVSKSSGKPMVKLVIAINQGGSEYFIYDYLLESFKPKLKHFCESVGLANAYKNGQFNVNDLVNRTGSCRVATEIHEVYGRKNRIEDYVGAAEELPF